jgi:L-alanine-DL-glutamate epimerase-like enolase superfamily enzyme
MKITGVDAIILRLPVVRDEVDGTQDDVILRVETDEGITGWGEVDSSPTVIKAVVDAEMSHGLSYGLREILLGLDPLAPEEAWREMYRKTRYYGRFGPVLHAMSGVDLALWDIAGKARGAPVHRLLGACERDRVKAYASALMPPTPAQARGRARELREAGFLAMKFGWGPIGKSPALDRELFHAVRQGAGPEAEIMIDAGQAYVWAEAVLASEALADLGVSFLEEPLDADDLEGYCRLSRESRVPIAAGEAESGLAAFRRLLEQANVDIVQPDLSRCGGFSEARRIARLAASRGRRALPHAFKSNILLAASLHFCATTPSADRMEFSMSTSPIRRRLTVTDLPMVDGYLEVPRGAGLGVDVNLDLLDELSGGARGLRAAR